MDKKARLDRIAEEIRKCSVCKRWGKGNPVPGEGNPDAEIVFIGEAPGRTEAATGHPFVGRSGAFLRFMIRETGIDESDVFITSPVKYLPLSGAPLKENVIHGRDHLLKQLSVIDPKLIVLLGKTACAALLDRVISIAAEHGSVVRKDGRNYLITFHPAYAMRFPEGKRAFTADFRKLKKLIVSMQAGKK
jgi:uracil-DNA glycosylase